MSSATTSSHSNTNGILELWPHSRVSPSRVDIISVGLTHGVSSATGSMMSSGFYLPAQINCVGCSLIERATEMGLDTSTRGPTYWDNMESISRVRPYVNVFQFVQANA